MKLIINQIIKQYFRQYINLRFTTYIVQCLKITISDNMDTFLLYICIYVALVKIPAKAKQTICSSYRHV